MGQSLASDAKESLEGAPLTLQGSHHLIALPIPNVQTTSYDIGDGHRAYDVTLRYDLLTQYIS
jgi:hypothetical protein